MKSAFRYFLSYSGVKPPVRLISPSTFIKFHTGDLHDQMLMVVDSRRKLRQASCCGSVQNIAL